MTEATAPTNGPVKLYNIPRNSRIYGLQDGEDEDIVVIFGRLDGMYSYCNVEKNGEIVENEDGKPVSVHLGAAMTLTPHEDGYKVIGS